MASGDVKAFDHARFKLRELEIKTEKEEDKIYKIGMIDSKKSDEINRRMLRAIDAKLAILNNL